jgi:hypothetical protein
MGVNNSCTVVRPTTWVCTDLPTAFDPTLWDDPSVMKFVPARHRHLLDDGARMTLTYPETNSFNLRRWFDDEVIRWGASTMFVAVRILLDLGVREVYLLGCDLKMDPGREYAYEWPSSPSHVAANARSYRLIQDRFRLLRPLLEAHGLQIFNCNPTSRLTAFDFCAYDQAIARSLERPCPTGPESHASTADTASRAS